MVKHIQTIRLQQPTNFLSGFDHFVGLALNPNQPRGNDHLWYILFYNFIVTQPNLITSLVAARVISSESTFVDLPADQFCWL